MAENTNIEWTTHSFNPWIGCQKVGPGCDNCYAETWDNRFDGGRWGPHATRTRTRQSNWDRVVTWDRKAGAAGRRERVFVASLADVCDTHASIDPAWRADLAALVLKCPNLDFLFLTKRAGNIEKILGEMFPDGAPSNLWMGITVTGQAEADRDIVKLLQAKTACGFPVAFLSVEPMLGAIDLENLSFWDEDAKIRLNALTAEVWVENSDSAAAYVNASDGVERIDWVIVGGESGSNARPMSPLAARELLEACVARGVPALFKQWGEWAPMDIPPGARGCPTESGAFCRVTRTGEMDPTGWPMERVGKTAAGRMIDGRTWDGLPATEKEIA